MNHYVSEVVSDDVIEDFRALTKSYCKNLIKFITERFLSDVKLIRSMKIFCPK
jgi:hypothetical protein